MGFEPTTSSMPSRRAPNCATAPLSNRFFSLPHTLRDFRPSLRTVREFATSSFSNVVIHGSRTIPVMGICSRPIRRNTEGITCWRCVSLNNFYAEEKEPLRASPGRGDPRHFFPQPIALSSGRHFHRLFCMLLGPRSPFEPVQGVFSCQLIRPRNLSAVFFAAIAVSRYVYQVSFCVKTMKLMADLRPTTPSSN